MGTPKKLIEAIESGLDKGTGTSELPDIIAQQIIDFLSQKFCASMLENPESEEILSNLFKKIKRN